MDSNLEVEVGRVFEQRGRGGGVASPGPGMSYAKPLSRSGEITIVPRANFPVGQPATPIHGRNTECERVLMLPLLGPGNLSLFVIAAGRVSRRFAFRRPSGAYTLCVARAIATLSFPVELRSRGPCARGSARTREPREKSIDIDVHTVQTRV